MTIDLSEDEIRFLMKVLVNNYAEDYEDFDPKNIGDRGTAGFLIGKFIHAKGAYKTYIEVKKERYLREPINEKLFMGTGNVSLVKANKLHKRLQFAISELSGMEQNGGMGTEFDVEADIQSSNNIKDVIRDMLVAFNLKPEDLK
jgi:hypothetical protein